MGGVKGKGAVLAEAEKCISLKSTAALGKAQRGIEFSENLLDSPSKVEVQTNLFSPHITVEGQLSL